MVRVRVRGNSKGLASVSQNGKVLQEVFTVNCYFDIYIPSSGQEHFDIQKEAKFLSFYSYKNAYKDFLTRMFFGLPHPKLFFVIYLPWWCSG